MGGVMGFYRFYRRGYKYFIKNKIIYNYFVSERMQRFTIRKKVEGPKEKKVMEEVMGVLVFSFIFWFVVCIQGCGGGGSVRRRNTLHVVGGRQ
jgi:hypothetical protein